MQLQFAPQCCDAAGYLELGHQCFADGRCWNSLRPLGMVLYASLPYRLGLPPESLIYFNLGLVLISSFLAARLTNAVWPPNGRVLRFMRYPIAMIPYVAFLWAPCFNSLSDAPAAALALSGLWLTCLMTVERRGPVAASMSGLLLGLSAFMRTQYLFPVLMFGALYAAIAFYRKPAVNAVALLVALLMPLSLQVATTAAHTGNWSFLDRWATAWYMGPRHVTLALYGYDTLFPARVLDPTTPSANPDLVTLYDGAAVGYDGLSCFKDSHTGLLPALRHGDVNAALCLIVKRQFFYFGSYARLGLVYLPSPEVRIWRWWLLALNIVALAVSLYWLLISSGRLVAAPILVWLSSIWLIATYGPPEQRFFATFHTAMWVVALAAVSSRPTRSRDKSMISL